MLPEEVFIDDNWISAEQGAQKIKVTVSNQILETNINARSNFADEIIFLHIVILHVGKFQIV